LAILWRHHLAANRSKVDRPRAAMIFSRARKAPPQTNRMLVVVDLQEFLLRVLAAALRRPEAMVAFHDLLAAAFWTPSPILAGD